MERRWHMVPLAESLQSLELVHGLKELTVDRLLIPQDCRNRRPHERILSRERLCFMPRGYTEPPVFLGDLVESNCDPDYRALKARAENWPFRCNRVAQTWSSEPCPSQESVPSLTTALVVAMGRVEAGIEHDKRIRRQPILGEYTANINTLFFMYSESRPGRRLVATVLDPPHLDNPQLASTTSFPGEFALK